MNDKINELLNANINLGTVAYAIAGIVVLMIVRKIFADIKALKSDMKNLPTASNDSAQLRTDLERKCAQNYKQFENSLKDLDRDVRKFNTNLVSANAALEEKISHSRQRVEIALSSHIKSMDRRVTHLERTFDQPPTTSIEGRTPSAVSPMMAAAGNAFNAEGLPVSAALICEIPVLQIADADGFAVAGQTSSSCAEQTEEKKFKRGLLAYLSDDSKYNKRSVETVSKYYDEDLIDDVIEKELVEEEDGRNNTYLRLTRKGWLSLSKQTRKYGQFNPEIPTVEGSWINIAKGVAMIDENGKIQPRKNPAL